MEILHYYKGILSIKGTIDRAGYLLVILTMFVLVLLSHSLATVLFPPTDNLSAFLWAISITDTLLLVLTTPTIIKRLKAIRFPSFLVLLFWIALPFATKYTLILRDSVSLNINLMLTTTIITNLAAVWLLLVLAGWPGKTLT